MAGGLLYRVPVHLSFLYVSQAGCGGCKEIRNAYEVLKSNRLRLQSSLRTVQMLRKCREMKQRNTSNQESVKVNFLHLWDRQHRHSSGGRSSYGFASLFMLTDHTSERRSLGENPHELC
jgi:hypothetical protein